MQEIFFAQMFFRSQTLSGKGLVGRSKGGKKGFCVTEIRQENENNSKEIKFVHFDTKAVHNIKMI